MSDRRLELQTIFEGVMHSNQILEDGCDYHVYFQPPMSLQMKYPCIRYERSSIDVDYADNYPYRKRRRYKVTFISKDPDDPIVEALSDLPMCSHDRFYIADNLNHDVFTIFY